ncbi:copper-translocating P-type ATPase [Labrys miyagiensis]
MTCCALDPETYAAMKPAPPSGEEILLASRPLGGGLRQSDLSVPRMHCAACIQAIETTVGRLPGVAQARVNLSARRVAVQWREDAVPPLVEALAAIGYDAHLFEPDARGKDAVLVELVRSVAIAGFAASNIMLLSVSVWSGADAATRDLFHWLSALIAIPALAFSGRIFFRSAWGALSHGRMNMDVPIAIGVSLAYAMSLYETIHHAEQAYFDASVSLLFFLLIGRTLDYVMREKARAAVTGLARLAPRGATVLRFDGSRGYLPIGEIEPGMHLALAAGDRVPVDARVLSGASDLDCSLVTGESEPERATQGSVLRAGTLNLTGALTVEALAGERDSFLAEMLRLMEAAEGGRARYRRLADRVSALYAPVVHVTAFATFLGWMVVSGDWHRAITVAIAVLIITCPCALGLAVPIVQVMAARRLFENGIMVRDGSAMERLAEIDTVAFDKTGVLTTGMPRFAKSDEMTSDSMVLAGALAAHSRHPLSRAIADVAWTGGQPSPFDIVTEQAGYGMEGNVGTDLYRLGRPDWALDRRMIGVDLPETTKVVLSRNGAFLAAFDFEDELRPGAVRAVRELSARGLELEILSGDRPQAVKTVASALGVDRFEGGLLPGSKAERIAEFTRAGKKVLMVGDGLNDVPALAAAYVSMAPATAADIGRNAADFVFLRSDLSAVPIAIETAGLAARLIRQNFVLAIGYNVLAVPIAILGHASPLIAAVAMSLSSLLVIANAMRLVGGGLSIPDFSPRSKALRTETAR